MKQQTLDDYFIFQALCNAGKDWIDVYYYTQNKYMSKETKP